MAANNGNRDLKILKSTMRDYLKAAGIRSERIVETVSSWAFEACWRWLEVQGKADELYGRTYDLVHRQWIEAGRPDAMMQFILDRTSDRVDLGGKHGPAEDPESGVDLGEIGGESGT